MNIEGVNLSSLLLGNNAVESGASPLPENGTLPESFSNTLVGQLALFSEANSQGKPVLQPQPTTLPQALAAADDLGGLLKQQGTAVLNEISNPSLPLQHIALPQTIGELYGADSLSKQPDTAVLTEESAPVFQLQRMALPQTVSNPYDITSPQKKQGTAVVVTEASDPNKPTSQLQPIVLPQSLDAAKVQIILPEQKNGEQELTALVGGYLPKSYKKTAVATNKDTGLETALQAFTDALAAITPALSNNNVAAAATMNNATVLNAPTLAKPLPDNIKPNMPGKEEVIANGFLQKETVIYQPTPDGQAFNLQNLDNTPSTDKTQALDKQAPILGSEKTLVSVVAEMVPQHRQLESRTDMPAITRHLSHPGWSKELGEQIVWMNNKAIPAAEIKLNPAHLGPISVRIDVNQDQATIVFTAQHTEVKDAIEASIPKLREMLASQQLNLANVNISQNATSDQGRSQSQPQPQPFFKPPEHQGQGVDSGADSLEKNEPDRGVVSKGLLSLYA